MLTQRFPSESALKPMGAQHSSATKQAFDFLGSATNDFDLRSITYYNISNASKGAITYQVGQISSISPYIYIYQVLF